MAVQPITVKTTLPVPIVVKNVNPPGITVVGAPPLIPIEITTEPAPVRVQMTLTGQGPTGEPGPIGPEGESVISYCPETPVPDIGASVSVTYDTSIEWMMLGLPVACGNPKTLQFVGSFTVIGLDKGSRTASLLRTS